MVTNRNISIGGSNGHLYYLDDSGNVLWTVSPGCYVHGQVFFDNLIGFTNSCGNYFIYDLNGNQILQTNLGYGWINIPVIEGSFAYIPDGNGFVIKLNKNTGHIEWANLVGNGSNIPMIIGKNFVYLSSLDEQIYQINKETGGIALSFNAFSDVPHSPYFMLDKGKLYVGGNQKLFVFSVNDTISDCEWPTLYHDNWRTSNPQFPVLTGIKNNYVNKAQKYHLYQNYPNPFNPTTTISYDLPKAGQVKLTIYNMLGQKIKSLINHRQLPGQYSVTWDGKDDLGNEVPSGIYLYQLQVGNSIQAKKMILTR
ncbi:MAG: T9SS C-terminal target domain-containing protein [Methanobacteriota archaeon]|nr:MAG: T9SS C-terminal target domain-containing protein [Euryarchaeota archaeon]